MFICGSFLIPVAAADDLIVLLTRDEILPDVHLIAIEDDVVQVRDRDREIIAVPIAECIGFICPDTELSAPHPGVVALVDGQQYPGEAVTISGPGRDLEVLRWRHRWFGLMRFPLEEIAWIGLAPGVTPPRPADSDVVVLRNGDRLEGFLTELGDAIAIEMEDDSVVRVPLERCSAVRLVNPAQPAAEGVRRLWIKNGSVVDVTSIALGDDQLIRLDRPAHAEPSDEFMLHLSHIAGVMFDPGGLVPLASIDPHDIEGPPVRYIVPRPSISTEPAPLGLRAITLRGPIIARYSQPRRAERFVARVRLIDETSTWADCEVVVRNDGEERFRVRLNREQPEAEIDADLGGAELSIEVTEGAHGPIEDRIVLERAMIIGSSR